MIDFYTWNTPNGQKIAIMLAEANIPFVLHKVDITKNEQFSAEFLAINPNNKIPAIVDQNGPNHLPLKLFESGAILIYLAEKTGRFLPSDPGDRILALQWLMFQMAGVGPMCGQAHHFMHYAAEKIPYAINRYQKEVHRLYQVMDKHLKDKLYFAEQYSIADMAIFPWVRAHAKHGIDLANFENVWAWLNRINERSAVQQALHSLE